MLVTCTCALASRSWAQPPNIIIIFADDLGYGDVSTYNAASSSPTPNIDSIAASGAKFTDGYVTAPVCSPSRAGLMTGRYQQRFGFDYLFIDGTADARGLPLSEITLAELFQREGYATGMMGKWHVGVQSPMRPAERGFDVTLVTMRQYVEDADSDVIVAGIQFTPTIGRQVATYDESSFVNEQYLTDLIAERASEFISRHSDQPFFLYVPFTAPHTPLQTIPKYFDRFPNIQNEAVRIYASMVSALDDGVGLILQTLADNGLRNNTIVFFLSDNGCPDLGDFFAGPYCSNAPFKNGKLWLTEGGIRIPFLMQWPSVLPAGVIYREPISSLDIFPTALTAAGIDLPSDRTIDGVDILPALLGTSALPPHDNLFWRSCETFAVRKGKWKLFRSTTNDRSWLFDLDVDPGETTDVSLDFPQITSQMISDYNTWDAQMIPPQWTPFATNDVTFLGVSITLCN